MSERWRDPAGTPGGDGFAQVWRREKGGLSQGPGEALQGGPGELVVPEGTPQGSSGRELWKSKDCAGKLLAVAQT